MNGETVSGYIRSDLVEVTQTAQAETPAETTSETPSETPSETESVSTDEYSVSYADDGTGTGVSDWYLNDNVNGTRYKISDLLNAQQTNESNIAVMEEQTGNMRMIIIILAVIIALLVIVVTILIFRLRNSYEDDGYDADDYDDEDEDEDDMSDVDEDFSFGNLFGDDEDDEDGGEDESKSDLFDDKDED